MKRIITVIFITVLPLALGFIFSSYQSSASTNTTGKISENHSNIPSSDQIVLASRGVVLKLESNVSTKVTENLGLIDPVWSKGSLIAVLKSTNYSSIGLFSSDGTLQKKLFDGSSKLIDNSKWVSDPAVSSDGSQLAYVSDKNRFVTGVPDGALFLESLATGKARLIESPNAYTGGITTPRFDPVSPNLVAYSFYQYSSSNNPFSTVQIIDTNTGKVRELTNEKQNAFQEDFSPDGTKMIFLGRQNELPDLNMYIADFNGVALSNIRIIHKGDLAYPRFSFNGQNVYFLQATKNHGYDLYKADVSPDSIRNVTQITSGEALNGDSSFDVSKK
jgi:Tol biopolymer transport system component